MAAGASTRLGTAKQLLPWKDSTLIETAIATASDLSTTDVYVVLGAHFQPIADQLRPYQVHLLNNKDWELGLGQSIAFGVDQIKQADYDGVLIMLADQPFITSDYLKQMTAVFQQGEYPIVATDYGF